MVDFIFLLITMTHLIVNIYYVKYYNISNITFERKCLALILGTILTKEELLVTTESKVYSTTAVARRFSSL